MKKRTYEKKLLELTGIYGCLKYDRGEKKYQYIQSDNSFGTGRIVLEFLNAEEIEAWIDNEEMRREALEN